MKRVSIVLNLFIAIASLGMLCYTLFAHAHLRGIAFDFVLSKTKEYTARVANVTEEAIKSPLTAKLMSADQIEVVEKEIASYRSDPDSYVGDLVSDPDAPQPAAVSKVDKFKQSIREHFDSTLSELIRDLRIFNFSNLLFSCAALFLLFRKQGLRERAVIGISLLVAVMTLYGMSMYVDGTSFFTILFKNYLGWAYPFVLLTSILYYLFRSPELILGQGPVKDD